YTYVLTATDDNGDKLAQSEGEIDHELNVVGSYPIGHTIVDGVDIWDGHLTMSAQDVLIPGRGLDLDFTRSYSSAGDSSQGPLGAGWTDSYNVQLIHAAAGGTFTVVGGEGSGNEFDAETIHAAGQEQDEDPTEKAREAAVASELAQEE